MKKLDIETQAMHEVQTFSFEMRPVLFCASMNRRQ